jgi:hypothetical protein
MSGRVRKSRSKIPSTLRRHHLSVVANDFGIEMVDCARCKDKRLACKFVEESVNCGNCLAANVPCDTGEFSVSEGWCVFILCGCVPW